MKASVRALRNPIPPNRDRAKYRLAILTVLLLLSFGLRVVHLTADRFHADEALYAGWALRILDGDPLLLDVPVDKPPLYLYTLAGSLIAFGRSEVAARLPSLASSVLGIAILYRLGRRLYGLPVGALAALFLALSPFDLLFARTAFTDSMLILWMLAALWAVASGRWTLAGMALGLAFATKQHTVFLIPLVVATGWVHGWTGYSIRGLQIPSEQKGWGHKARVKARNLLACTLGFALPLAGVVAWDSARWADRPSYWHQSAASYGGLVWAPFVEWGTRLVEWIGWARYLAGSHVLGILAVVGIAALLVHGWRRRPGARETWLDTVFVAYGLGYLLAHTVLQFSVWDRYLLPLAPLVALLWGRIVVQIDQATRHGPLPNPPPYNADCGQSERGREKIERPRVRAPDLPPPRLPGGIEGGQVRTFTQGLEQRQSYPKTKAPLSQTRRERRNHRVILLRVLCVSVVMLVFFSAWTATQNGYPIGGEHWAYQGLDQVAAYLKENAPPDAVLYHHWLRWHYTYYLHDTTFELRWWESGEHLRREALRTPERAQYIVLPDWHTLDPRVKGVAFLPVYETRRRDGSVSLNVYRIEPEQLASPADPIEKGSE